MKVKTECECGSKYTFFNKSRHMKTQKHQTYIKEHEKELQAI